MIETHHSYRKSDLTNTKKTNLDQAAILDRWTNQSCVKPTRKYSQVHTALENVLEIRKQKNLREQPEGHGEPGTEHNTSERSRQRMTSQIWYLLFTSSYTAVLSLSIQTGLDSEDKNVLISLNLVV